MKSKMTNSANDTRKHVMALEAHLEAVLDDRWHEYTAREIVKVLSHSMLGLNGGDLEDIPDAAEVIGFEGHNVVPVAPDVYQVLALIESATDDRDVAVH